MPPRSETATEVGARGLEDLGRDLARGPDFPQLRWSIPAPSSEVEVQPERIIESPQNRYCTSSRGGFERTTERELRLRGVTSRKRLMELNQFAKDAAEYILKLGVSPDEYELFNDLLDEMIGLRE